MHNQGTGLPSVKLADYQPPDFTVTHHEMCFEIIDDYVILSHSQSFHSQNPSSKPLILNGEDLELLEISMNSIALNEEQYAYRDDLLTITEVPQTFTLTTVVKLRPSENLQLSGLYQSNDILCTQCEAQGFRRISFSLDRPDVLSTFRVRIESPQATYCPVMLSNGDLESHGMLDNGGFFSQWFDPFPKPTYLFALVVGDLAVRSQSLVTDGGKSIRLSIYIEKKFINQTDFAMKSLIEAINWDEKRFGFNYDLNQFNIVAISDFNMGAMENKSLNIFNTKYILGSSETATDDDFLGIQAVIGHEYFHNWTGNRITCRDWFQLSLKEGLTVFRDQEFSSDLNERSLERIKNVNVLRKVQFTEDAGPMSHSVQPQAYAAIDNFYTATVYEKGAEIIRMYHTIMGEEKFQEGMKIYQSKFDGQAVRIEDFAQCMQEASGFPFTEQFFKWYTCAGTPHLNFNAIYDESNAKLRLTINQNVDALNPPQAMVIPVSLSFLTYQGEIYPINGGKESVSFVISHKETNVNLEGINQTLIPVLMRGFTAPVYYEYPYTLEELCILVKHCPDTFARYEAMQSYYRRILVMVISHPEAIDVSVSGLVKLMKSIFDDVNISEAQKALLLKFPDITDFINYLPSPIDIQATIESYSQIRKCIAVELSSVLTEFMNDCSILKLSADYNVDDAGKRALIGIAMQYLALSNKIAAYKFIVERYFRGNCMTERANALNAAILNLNDLGEDLFDDYYSRYQSQPLVIDKWFAIQARYQDDNAMDYLQKLSVHPDFKVTNPNRFRSLIASFMQNNLQLFHRKDGSGYQFVLDNIRRIAIDNPQLAARLLTGFSIVSKFDNQNKAQLKNQLETFKTIDNLSIDILEIINRLLSGLE